ncbi:MAG: thioredoxin domain-containing protein [Myxococcaceae bacterium]|jgi:protein-disulfide isomerase|nr:thioredoxin domain-containing protein [Myxococcaceae bacterium]
MRLLVLALSLSTLSASAQLKDLTSADLPPNLVKDLSPAQRELLVAALHRAQGMACRESAAQCIMKLLDAVGTAAQLVKSGKRVDEVADAISDKTTPLFGGRPPPSGAEPSERLTLKVPPTAPTLGPPDAPVTVMVWSDFECPFCKRLTGTFEQLRKRYGQQVRFVFRHQPLPFHPNARTAAQASMAAHRQGRFWEFHDLVFKGTGPATPDRLFKVAQELQLDLSRFDRDSQSGEVDDLIQQDIDEAQEVEARGTPTSFINGRKLGGAQPVEQFIRLIDAELRAAGKEPPPRR